MDRTPESGAVKGEPEENANPNSFRSLHSDDTSAAVSHGSTSGSPGWTGAGGGGSREHPRLFADDPSGVHRPPAAGEPGLDLRLGRHGARAYNDGGRRPAGSRGARRAAGAGADRFPHVEPGLQVDGAAASRVGVRGSAAAADRPPAAAAGGRRDGDEPVAAGLLRRLAALAAREGVGPA